MYEHEEETKYKKKKSQKSKSSKRSDHKHAYETVICSSGMFGYHWIDRCSICGRLRSKSYQEASKGMHKPGMEHRYSTYTCYNAEELHEQYPDVKIFDRKTDEKGFTMWEDEDLIQVY